MRKSKNIRTKQELQKCKEDPFYFIEKYCEPKIRISEEMKNFYRMVWEEMEKGNQVKIIRGRTHSHICVMKGLNILRNIGTPQRAEGSMRMIEDQN